MTLEKERECPIVRTVTLPDRTIDIVKLPDQPLIEIEYSNIESLLNPDSESFKILKEAMKRSRAFILTPTNEEEQPVGVNYNHIDANPQIFETLSKLLDRNLFSPQDIQHQIEIGQMMKAFPEHAGKIKSLVTKNALTVDQLFAEAMKDTPRAENPTIIYGWANVDTICEVTQERIDKALEYTLQKEKSSKKTAKQIIQEIKHFAQGEDINKSGTIENMSQFIGYVLRSFNESGGKPQVKDKELFDKIIEIFGPGVDRLGGAAPQMARLLNKDGENVMVTTPYQSPKQSNAYGLDNDLQYIKLTESGFTIGRVDDQSIINVDHPNKVNAPMEHEIGTKIVLDATKFLTKEDLEENTQSPEKTTTNIFEPTEYSAKKADRTIIKSNGYYDKDNNLIKPEPVFNCSDETLAQLAQNCPLFILNNLQSVESYKNKPEEYQRIITTLQRQIGIIRQAGSKIMIEVSGDTSDMRYLDDLKGLIDFISLNGGELRSVNMALSKRYPDMKVLPFDEKNKDYFSIFENASSLLEVSRSQIVNIHETETDLTVMHTKSKKELHQKTLANLHSKLKVYGHLVGLSPEEMVNGGNLSSLLSVEGKLEVLKFSIKYAKSLNLSLKEESKVIYEIMSTLSYYNPNGVSISLAPSKGLNGIAHTIATGAGDRTGSVAANEFYKQVNATESRRTNLD